MALPLLFDRGQFRWAPGWIFNSCSGPGSTRCAIDQFTYMWYSCSSFLSILLNLMFQVVMAREEHQQDSGLLSQASRYMVWCFFEQQLGLVRLVAIAAQNGPFYATWFALSILLSTFLPFMSLGMVQRRLELVERGFGQPLGAGMVAKIKLGVLLVMLAIDGYMSYVISRSVLLKPWVFHAFYSLLGVTNLAVAVIVIVGLARVCAAAEPSRLRAGSYAQAEAIWSRALLRQLCVALVLPCFISAALYLAEACYERSEGQRLAYTILSVSDQTLLPPLECMCLFFICGFFQPKRPELCFKKQKNMGNTSTSQILDADDSSPGGQQSSASLWNKTVQSLSARSLGVEELLEFFGRLGPRRDVSGAEAVMPFYDPWRSTTSDVVRGAIIPLSQVGSCGWLMQIVCPELRLRLPPHFQTAWSRTRGQRYFLISWQQLLLTLWRLTSTGRSRNDSRHLEVHKSCSRRSGVRVAKGIGFAHFASTNMQAYVTASAVSPHQEATNIQGGTPGDVILSAERCLGSVPAQSSNILRAPCVK
ncbi:unnamed protein product [Polarella glacialis]|uniref:Uncharacterized protein n=1 Tax=Polarella glacialis TaxID=89957 RepID=A0A813M064_POLGL|nr:unnamed protein product [Polarella glacialis]CAE8742999.1 unnamed protein product [Polarella glacialis]